MNKYILFDVGANIGTDSLIKTRDNSYVETWAFEPTPKLIINLTNESREYSNRYHVVPIALSDFDGIAQFNIAGQNDWGCSSLNTFSENLENTWPGREDFKVTEIIDVQVARFDTWYTNNNINIDKIDFFHCDTQGSDLKVLIGMGNLINLIQEGVVECAANEDVKLYKENHTKKEIEDFLISKNFTITNIVSNDNFSNELNIYFKQNT